MMQNSELINYFRHHVYKLNSRMTEMWQNKGKASKQAASNISKFNYHLQHTIPSLFEDDKRPEESRGSPVIQVKKGIRSMNYHFAEHLTDGVCAIDAEAIWLSALKIYVGSDCIKLTETSYKKIRTIKATYLPISTEVHEIIEFCIINNGDRLPLHFSRVAKSQLESPLKGKESQPESTLQKGTPKSNPSKDYELYVIHHCQNKGQDSNYLQWQNVIVLLTQFVQKYHFKQEMEDGQSSSKIHYHCIFNYQVSQGLLNFCSYKEQLYENYIREHLTIRDGELRNTMLFQGHLLQDKDRVSKKLEDLSNPAFDQSWKKWLRLSPENFKMFTVLKNKTIAEHKALHGESSPFEDHTLSSLVYRNMVSKEYNSKQALENIIHYMKWEKTMTQDYNLLIFERFHNLDFYTFLGYDLEGRCVVLNKAAHLNVNKIDSVDDYCNYFSYFLEIYIPRKLKGYASEFIILADMKDLCSDNFKRVITKRNIDDGLVYSTERQFKFIAFNVGSFASTLWKMMRHFIPKRTLAKISILSSDKDEIYETLHELMDASVIPEYLGGTNTRSYKDDLLDEIAYVGTKNEKLQQEQQ